MSDPIDTTEFAHAATRHPTDATIGTGGVHSMNPRTWFSDRNGIDWPTVLLGALAIAVMIGLAVAASTSAVAFGLYNPEWDGTSEFREAIDDDPDTEVELIEETNRYEEVQANETIAFVIAPESSYSETDTDRVQEFVDDGGTLVVMENFGEPGPELLETVGAEAQPDSRLILDSREYDRGPAMPFATTVVNHSRTAGVEQLALNYATAIEPANATVLVSTSDFAYLADSDEDEIGDDDDLTTYPVATTEPIGDGDVVVVGDPSIAINAMYDEPDNAAFLQAQYDEKQRVLFDLSHAGDVPPLVGMVNTLRGTPLLQALLGLLAIGAVAGLSHRRLTPTIVAVSRRVGQSPPSYDADSLSAADREAYLRQRHPDWDEDRIQRVIAALNRTQSKRDKQ